MSFPRKIVFQECRKINNPIGKEDDENTEAVIHDRVQGIGAQACEGWPFGWSGSQFKNERVHGLRYETHAEMEAARFEYIEVFYNRKWRPPMQDYRLQCSLWKTGLSLSNMKNW